MCAFFGESLNDYRTRREFMEGSPDALETDYTRVIESVSDPSCWDSTLPDSWLRVMSYVNSWGYDSIDVYGDGSVVLDFTYDLEVYNKKIESYEYFFTVEGNRYKITNNRDLHSNIPYHSNCSWSWDWE